MSFQTGDVVRLKCGGPAMTIGCILPSNPFAICYWFSKEGFYNKQEIPLAALEKWQGELPTDTNQ